METDPLINSQSSSVNSINHTDITIVSRVRKVKRLITVEPVVMLIGIGYSCLSFTKTFYCRDVIAKQYNASSVTNYSVCANVTDQDRIIDAKIQSDVSAWSMYFNLMLTVPSFFMSPILAAISDRVGRKVALLLPLFGMLVNFVICLFVALKGMPLLYFLIGDLLLGCLGGFSLAIVGAMAYVADITSVEKRTFGIIIIDMVMFVSMGLPPIIVGYIIEKAGYIPVFAIVIAFLLVGLLYTIFPCTLKETIIRRKDINDSSKVPKGKVLRDIVEVFKDNKGGRRVKLITTMVIVLLSLGVNVAYMVIMSVYCLGLPLCFLPSQVGIFNAVALCMAALGSLIGGKLLGQYLGDYTSLYISYVSMTLMMTATLFAKTPLLLYVSTLLGMLRFLPAPLCRSIASKMGTEDEQGTIFAIIGVLDNLSTFLIPVAFQAVYSSTVETNPDLVFYMMIGMLVPPFIITVFLQIYDRNRQKD